MGRAMDGDSGPRGPSRRRGARPRRRTAACFARAAAPSDRGAEANSTPTPSTTPRRRSGSQSFAARRRKAAVDRPRGFAWRRLIRPGENAARQV
jgi:hypothetical protein